MVFGLFRKKPVTVPGTDPRIVGLLRLHGLLNDEFAEKLYSDVKDYSPSELQFFTMSAISVYIQSYSDLPEEEMRAVVSTFTEQAIALMLFRMTNTSYDLIHDAFVDRFSEYAELIVGVTNASTTPEMQWSTMTLIRTMDKNVGVERNHVEEATQALKLVMPLTRVAADARDIFA